MNDELSDELGDSITLLVLERGAEWPSWGAGIRLRALNSAVEVQMDSESTEQFQQRVEARLARIAHKSMKLVAAGYACAASNEDRRRSRKALCTRILIQLTDAPRAELILAGGSWETSGLDGQRRGELIELWGELSIQVPGRLMSVRFEDPPSDSGVFRAAKKLEADGPKSSSFSEPEPESEDESSQSDSQGP